MEVGLYGLVTNTHASGVKRAFHQRWDVRKSESLTVISNDTRSARYEELGTEARDVARQVSVYLWGPSSDRSALSCTFNR